MAPPQTVASRAFPVLLLLAGAAIALVAFSVGERSALRGLVPASSAPAACSPLPPARQAAAVPSPLPPPPPPPPPPADYVTAADLGQLKQELLTALKDALAALPPPAAAAAAPAAAGASAVAPRAIAAAAGGGRDYAPGASDRFVDMALDNVKADGGDFGGRHAEIMSDPSNLYIPRVANAGKMSTTAQGDNVVTLHNGLVTLDQGYYGSFSKVLRSNGGVHEPGEERLFGYVVDLMRPGAVMVELGAYWAMYSIWFASKVPGARNYAVESDPGNIDIGRRSAALNGIKSIDFTQNMISNSALRLSSFLAEKKLEAVDLLHVDIQGGELDMLGDVTAHLDRKIFRYIFLSTHSQPLHADSMELLKAHGYRIIAAADFENESFFFDGIIIACPSTLLELPEISLGNRRRTPLRKGPFAFPAAAA